MPLLPRRQSARHTALLLSTLTACSAVAYPQAEDQHSSAATPSVLQQRYDRAQRFQAAQQLPAAAEQYRIFLADALGEIGVGLAQARLYEKAADDFDEALRLVPEFPMLRLQYARSSLQGGNPTRAAQQATEVLGSRGATQQAAAGAHEVLGRALLKQDHNAQAKEELEKAVALDPSFANGYELAIAEIDLGDAKGASVLFAEMGKSYGDQAILHLYFGQAYGGSDFQSQAKDEFQRALTLNPHLPGAHYGLAAAYLAADEGHVKDAEAELRKEIEVSPNDGAAYAALGHLLASQAGASDATQEVEHDLLQATQLAPENPDGFLFLGQLYADTNRPDQAETALRQAIALTTDPSRNGYQVQKAHYLLGRLLLKSGDNAEGKKELAASEELLHHTMHRDQTRLAEYLNTEGTHAETSLTTGLVTTMLSSAEAANRAKRVHTLEEQLTPAIADSYNNLGAIEASGNDFRGAVLSFERAAEWNPKLAGLDYNWGRAAFSAGMTAEATGPLQRYLTANPGDAGARAVLGLCLFSQKRFAAVREVLAPLQGKTDTPLQVQYVYADALLESGDTHNGVAQLEDLAKAHPEVAAVHDALGKAYSHTEPARAEQEYNTAVKIEPKDVDAQEALATIYLARGRAAEAVTHLKLALALQPSNPALQEKLAEANRLASQQ